MRPPIHGKVKPTVNTQHPNLTAPQKQLPPGTRWMPEFNDTYRTAVQAVADFPDYGLPAPATITVRPGLGDDGRACVSIQYAPWHDRSDIDAWTERFGTVPNEWHHSIDADGSGNIYLRASGEFPGGARFEVTFVLSMSVAQVTEYMTADHGPKDTWDLDTLEMYARAIVEAERFEAWR